MTATKPPQSETRPLLERLADAQHDIWSHWMRWFFENDTLENRERWKRQMVTDYDYLTEHERESDRQVVREFLGFLLDEPDNSPRDETTTGEMNPAFAWREAISAIVSEYLEKQAHLYPEHYVDGATSIFECEEANLISELVMHVGEVVSSEATQRQQSAQPPTDASDPLGSSTRWSEECKREAVWLRHLARHADEEAGFLKGSNRGDELRGTADLAESGNSAKQRADSQFDVRTVEWLSRNGFDIETGDGS